MADLGVDNSIFTVHLSRHTNMAFAPMADRDLAPHIKETLIARHGSLAFAAERLGISYDRLKKAIQRNRFSVADLELLLPDRRYEDLKGEFVFEIARRHTVNEPASGLSNGFDLFTTLEDAFRSLQRAARDTDFNIFVTDLYGKLGETRWIQSMVLFCHETSQPEEWKPERVELLRALSDAVKEGATIIYLMERDIANTVEPRTDLPPDNIDRQFLRHRERLKSLCADEEGHNGYVALLRVPRCAFCIPYQKPALFSRYGEESTMEHHALTSVEVPEAINGERLLGAIAIPQAQVVAYAMRDYVFDLVQFLKQSKQDKRPFHFESYSCGGPPDRDDKKNLDELIQRLSRIAEL